MDHTKSTTTFREARRTTLNASISVHFFIIRPQNVVSDVQLLNRIRETIDRDHLLNEHWAPSVVGNFSRLSKAFPVGTLFDKRLRRTMRGTQC